MKIEEFLSRLEAVQQGADASRWTAKCPAHDDGQNSLGVHVTESGKILLKCYAGCSTEDIVAAMGLKMSDLFADDGKKSGRKSKKASAPKAVTPEEVLEPKPLSAYKKKRPSKHVAFYEYEDENGVKIFRVERRVYTDEKGGKTFIQQHPNENGGWDYGVSSAGVKRVPFHLPKILAAGKAGHNVVIFEGEKDVLNAERCLGIAATCNSGGAGKWEPGWGKYFAGVPKILIVADYDSVLKLDEKSGEAKLHAVGQRHALKVERLLRDDGYQGEIKKIVLPDVDSVKCKDFSDWMEARLARGLEVGKSAFAEAIKAAGDWPEEWNWKDGDADLNDLQRAQDRARNSASGKAEGGERSEAEEAGRFGRLVPAPLHEKTRRYAVDLQIDRNRRARFIIGVDTFQFEPWRSEDNGKTFTTPGAWTPMKGQLSQFVGMALGCLFSFCDGDRKAYSKLIDDLTISIVVAWLRARGKFFADHDNPCYQSSMYFNEGDGVLYSIDSADFLSSLATEARIIREKPLFKDLKSVIQDLALNPKETPRVVPSRQWDRKGDLLYLSSGDSNMYRIDGGKIELVPNGTDGVLFLRGYTFNEWKLEDGDGVDPFSDAMVFKTADYTDVHSVMNMRLWFLNLFACHKNKPMLLIEGPAQSGKTTIARLMKGILGMNDRGKPDTNVTSIVNTDKAAEDFWVIVHNGRLEIFDNIDSKIKWTNNELQTVSTGGSHKGRKLYATDDTYILYPNSHIILTSNNPIFATEGGGLPDRIIQVHIGGRRKESKDEELGIEIAQKRDLYMTWTARTLARAMLDKKPVDQSVNRRHPDYGKFAIRCARALNCEMAAINAMSAAEIDKALLPIINETVSKEIYRVLMSQDPKGCLKFKAGEMSDLIIQNFGEDNVDDKTRQIYGSRAIGKRLSTFSREFSIIFKMASPRIVEGRTQYEFTGLTAQGQAIIAAGGGLVGFSGQFAESPDDTKGAGEFAQNNTFNPPNPPYARAQHDVSSFSRKKDEIYEDLDF